MKDELKTNPRNQKSLNLDLILLTNYRINKGEVSENKNREKSKLRMKLIQITILK